MKDLIRRTENQLSAIKSDVTMQVALAWYNAELKKFGRHIDEIEASDVNFNSSSNRLCVSINISNVEYDVIMADVDTCIGSTSTIDCFKRHKVTLVSHNNVTLDMFLTLEGPLPEEDLQTLKALGKVKTQVDAPSIYEVVSCDL